MSKVAEGWRGVKNRDAVQEFSGADREGLPEISELLCGKPSTQGLIWDRPPYTLCLWLEGAQVKFCFSAGDQYPKLWGTIRALAEGLLGIEDALCKDRCEWKAAKKSQNGFTHGSR